MRRAFVFPGQGSQSVGMLADLGGTHSVVGETFDEASDVLGYDLWALVQNGPREDLDATRRTQPAMLAAGVATWRVWQDHGGGRPDVMAGHSLGEYSALVCSGALDFAAAVRIVERRAELMQDAVPEGEGAMAAVLGLGDEQVEEACQRASEGQVVAAVNYNAPGQVVVAGERDAVDRVRLTASELGARRVLPLPVSVPSHCELMRGAAAALRDVLADVAFRRSNTPVLHNAGPVEAGDDESLRDALCRQLYSPVRWRSDVESLVAAGVDRFYECGPGKVLSGLIKRTNRSVKAHALHDHASLIDAAQEQST